jgi:type IV secretion system protein VirB10
MTGKTLASPEGLAIRGAPLASARLSRKAVLAAVGVLAVVLGFIIINVSKEPVKATSAEQQSKELEPAWNGATSLKLEVPEVASLPKVDDVPALPAAAAPVLVNAPIATPGASSADLARLSGTEVEGFAKEGFRATPPSPTPPSPLGRAMSAAAVPGISSADEGGDAQSSALRGSGAGRLGFASQGLERDPNQQAEKAAFLKQVRRSSTLEGTLNPPTSRYELKTGTVIPGILLSELNSDLPGEILAQVTQNVYDTASGNQLLIAQGTKLFGHYDSRVAFGQGRLLVSWQRLIYPDGSTLELDGMSGVGREGKSGFADRVNSHYGRIFGAALLTSVISAGFQISQPQQNSTLTPLSNQQIAAGAVGQQLADVGTEIASRNLQVQPTIEIRKGYRFHVMVNKDIIFPGSYRF